MSQVRITITDVDEGDEYIIFTEEPEGKVTALLDMLNGVDWIAAGIND